MRVVRATELSVEVELGELSVTMLSDGETGMPLTHLCGPDGTALSDAELDRAEIIGGKLRLPVRAYLVRGREEALLIDAGAGNARRPTLGKLPEALQAAGVAPGAVTLMALTHTHVDHLGGLVDTGGDPAFPNARRLFVPVEELDAFRAEPRMMPLLPLLMPLEQGDGPMHGVTAINASGHSPGHMAYLVEGRLLILGDLVHHAAVQFARPDVTWTFDADPAAARASRLSLLEQAADAGWIIAGAHLPGSGIGSVSREAEGYAFHPVTAHT